MTEVLFEGELVLDIVLLITVVGCLHFLHIRYQEYQNLKFKYAFYALRDELAWLVYEGKLEEQSEPYQQLRDSLNYSIATTDDFSVLRVARMIIASLDEKSGFSQSLFQTDNEQIKDIASRYLQINRKLLLKNSSPVFFTLLGLVGLTVLSVAKIGELPRRAIDSIDHTAEKLQTA